MSWYKKCPRLVKIGLAVCIALTLGFIGSRNYVAVSQFGQNPIMDTMMIIVLCILAIAEILLFPACIIGVLQEDIFKKGEKLTGEVLFSVFCYILCLLLLTAYCYAFVINDSFVNCMKGFYGLSSADGIIGLIQIMSGTIINTVLLGLLVAVFQRYIEKDK